MFPLYMLGERSFGTESSLSLPITFPATFFWADIVSFYLVGISSVPFLLVPVLRYAIYFDVMAVLLSFMVDLPSDLLALAAGHSYQSLIP